MYKKSSSVTERIAAVCLVWFVPLAILIACGTASKKVADPAPVVLISQEKFDANGEIAKLIASVHDDSLPANEEPPRIREHFDRLVRDRREHFDRKFRDQRDDTNAVEKTKRDRFLSDLAAARSSFVNGPGRKADSKTTADFNANQDRDRSAYFVNENRRRRDLEEQLTSARRAVEDDIRDLTGSFNAEFRALVSRREQARASATPTPEAAANRALIEEFKKIPKGSPIPLGAGGQ